ncbi:MAG: hypothetical protein JWO82_3312 [Akkermansiaceae bacterium]|nr:hypothetical protein [Akkermansiaceae bacterium]
MSAPDPREFERAMFFAANERIQKELEEQNWDWVYLWTAGGLMVVPITLAGLLIFLRVQFPVWADSSHSNEIGMLLGILACAGFMAFVVVAIRMLIRALRRRSE